MTTAWCIVAAIWILWLIIIALSNFSVKQQWKNHASCYRIIKKVSHRSRSIWPIKARGRE
jgi:hypothetical protein